MDLAFVAPFEQLFMAQQNTLTYIAGYLARQIWSKVSDECGCKLRGQLQSSIKETFLAAKQCEDLQGPGLVIPSRGLQNVVETMMIIYKQFAEDLLTGQNVKTNLVTLPEKEAAQLFLKL
ncbi:hypothetical protein PoB_006370900 [Plakobranchus ocellatus]|uniref:COG complex subunit 6 n=1 Tax=Plakobranchus ocellatus TaxID=259542 RepID=A0AAV4CZF0_9GAST|nr:hypothetical protein PoB_006370900 [Plakobranchus ocellatus]